MTRNKSNGIILVYKYLIILILEVLIWKILYLLIRQIVKLRPLRLGLLGMKVKKAGAAEAMTMMMMTKS